MNPLPLKPAVAALIQHIELQKAGWWDKTIERLILGAIYLEGRPLAVSEIHSVLKEVFHAPVAQESLQSAIQSLAEQNSLLHYNERFHIPVATREEFEREIKAADEIEQAAKEKFSEILGTQAQEIKDQLDWPTFESGFLRPILAQTSKDTYNLASGSAPISDESQADEFLHRFDGSVVDQVKLVIATFLDPKNEVVRHYIGMLLHAHFCVSSSGLTKEVLSEMERLSSASPKFNLFVDTNFLFSLLELHENPSNETAAEVRELIKAVGKVLQIKFYITTRTIEEAQASISATKNTVNGIAPSSRVANAALNVGLSGTAARYFTERARRGGTFSPDDYFAPYLKDFVRIARTRDVEFYNEKLDAYSMRQDVVDTINTTLRYQDRYGDQRPKKYEVVAHDAILWHFVDDKRSSHVESPLDAVYWILTLDYRFLRLDRAKQRQKNGKIPICIHPTSLIQFLQFWIPRNDEFEEAMLGTLRLPFLFQRFDADAERTSIRILQALSRFEGVDDLPQEAVTAVVLNEGLRERIGGVETENEELGLVRDELLEEMRDVTEEKDRQLENIKEELTKREAEIGRLAEQNETKAAESAALESRVTELSGESESAKTALAEQKRTLENLQKTLDEQNEKQRTRTQRTKYWIMLFAALASSVVAGYLTYQFVKLGSSKVGHIALSVGVSCAVFSLVHLCIERWSKSHAKLGEWLPLTSVIRFRKWLWGVLIVGMLINLASDLITKEKQPSSQTGETIPSDKTDANPSPSQHLGGRR